MATTYTPARLFTEFVDNATIDTLYTVATGDKLKISKMTFTNTDTSDCTINIWLVPLGSSASDENLLIDTQKIRQNSTWICSAAEGHVLGAGGRVQAQASVASKVTAIGAGVVITTT